MVYESVIGFCIIPFLLFSYFLTHRWSSCISMPNKRVQWKAEDEILPDFLEDSLFLPVWDYTEPKRSARPRPASLAEILISKPARLAYGVLLLLVILSGFHRAHLYDRVMGPSCYFRDPVVPDASWRLVGVDWSQYAYALYATDAEYLCNAVTIFDSLQQHGSKADRLLLYADTLDTSDEDTREGRLLAKARDELGVNTQPVKVLHQKNADCELLTEVVIGNRPNMSNTWY